MSPMDTVELIANYSYYYHTEVSKEEKTLDSHFKRTGEIGLDARQRVEWINKRVSLSDMQQSYVEFQIKEAVINSHR